MDHKTEIDHLCRATLDQFMDALNKHDAGAMDAAMHFPHYRLTRAGVSVYPKAGSNPMDLFDRLRQQDDWLYSRWRERTLVQFDDHKAHYALSYTRHRSDHSVIGTYESLYILTHEQGRWGIQLRSSFGP
jgi:hypothetical protein